MTTPAAPHPSARPPGTVPPTAPTSTHQRVLDLRRQLDEFGFDWGCLGSFEQWLDFAFGVAGVYELDEHEALEVTLFLDEAIARGTSTAAGAARHPCRTGTVLPPPGSAS